MLGDSVLYGPNRLLANDVILVVPHYRLGALGKQLNNIQRTRRLITKLDRLTF